MPDNVAGRGFPREFDHNTLQGRYGEDYVRSLASAWGVAHGTIDPIDLLKADLSLTWRGEHAGRYNPQVWAQVKTTSRGRIVGPHLHYEVLVKNAQVNPASVKLPTGNILHGRDLKTFKSLVAQTTEKFRNLSRAPAVASRN